MPSNDPTWGRDRFRISRKTMRCVSRETLTSAHCRCPLSQARLDRLIPPVIPAEPWASNSLEKRACRDPRLPVPVPTGSRGHVGHANRGLCPPKRADLREQSRRDGRGVGRSTHDAGPGVRSRRAESPFHVKRWPRTLDKAQNHLPQILLVLYLGLFYRLVSWCRNPRRGKHSVRPGPGPRQSSDVSRETRRFVR
jgi:hypothetical protein